MAGLGPLFYGMVSELLVKRCSPMTGNSYYASSAWRRKRQERLDLDNHQCQGCGITRQQLEQLSWPSLPVHHKNAGPPDFMYPSFGNEQMSDLLTFCVECHDGITNSVRRQRYKLDPKKQVKPVLVATSSLYVPTLSVKKHVSTSHSSNPFPGREPTIVPQRSDRRPSQCLLQGDERDLGKTQED